MDLYKKLIYYWLGVYNVAPSDRDDVFQNVLVKMAKSLRYFRKKEKGKFRNWLRTVVHSIAMNYHHEMKKRWEELQSDMDNYCKKTFEQTSLPLPSYYGLPDDPNEISDKQRNREDYILKKNIRKLLENQFQSVHIEAFFLTLDTKYNSVEIGKRLGLSPDNVRQIACRIRKYIRDNWEEVL